MQENTEKLLPYFYFTLSNNLFLAYFYPEIPLKMELSSEVSVFESEEEVFLSFQLKRPKILLLVPVSIVETLLSELPENSFELNFFFILSKQAETIEEIPRGFPVSMALSLVDLAQVVGYARAKREREENIREEQGKAQ